MKLEYLIPRNMSPAAVLIWSVITSHVVTSCLTSTQGIALRGHVIKVSNHESPLSCYYFCRANDVVCQSLNYFTTSGICEVNNRTAVGRDSDLVYNPDAMYFENPYRGQLGVSPQLPASSCREIKDDTKHKAVSTFYWLDDTASRRHVFCDMQENTEACPDSFCANNGTCLVFMDGYYCACQELYTGQTCQQSSSADPCLSSPCLYGSTCSGTAGSDAFICTCVEGFTGTLCVTPTAVECQTPHYSVIDDRTRHTSYQTTAASRDYYITPGWYRFQGNAGKKMPTQCIQKGRCGANAPGWLNGVHPNPGDGVVIRKVCFSYSSCCSWSTNIQVRNCGAFYLYYLVRPPSSLHLRYCGTS